MACSLAVLRPPHAFGEESYKFSKPKTFSANKNWRRTMLGGLVGECRLDLIELGCDKPTFGKDRPRQFKIQIGEVRQQQ